MRKYFLKLMSLFIIGSFFVACNNDLQKEIAISEKSKRNDNHKTIIL